MRVAVVGGGVAGLAAARYVESLLPEAEIVLLEGSERLGGKLLTEGVDGFVIEGAADSFLSRKERGVGLCEELGLDDELIGRRPENARSFVRRGGELHPLPEGLTGMIPTNLDALAESPLLSAEGRARLAAEVDLLPAPRGVDESIASFVSRRLGREAYENLVEPLMTGIYGGDGDQLSLEATFPNLRALELEHGSVIRGLAAQPSAAGAYPPFVSLRGGMDTLVTRVVKSLDRTRLETEARAVAVRSRGAGYAVELDERAAVEADAIVLAVPAFVAAKILAGLDEELADAHAQIPYASSAIVTHGYRNEDVPRPLDGYGYVVPRVENADVLACTWTTSKWEARAPDGYALLRVYLGRFGGRDVTRLADEDLVALAGEELRTLEIEAEPHRTWIHRWPHAMPQYVLGHPERLERIDDALERHPGLTVAGAAYRGVGIPDCIRSGEEAALAISRAVERVPG